MKRTGVEIVLLLGLLGAGAFGWMNLQKGNLASSNVAALETKAKATEGLLVDSRTKIKSAEEATELLRNDMKPLRAKALELDAAKEALANGAVLNDLESLYKQQKGLSTERQLGLGALRLLARGSADPGVAEAFQKALQMADWNGRKKTICAAQIGLAAAGQNIKVLSECAIQPTGAAVAPVPDGQASAGHQVVADDHKHGQDNKKVASAHAAPHWDYEGAMGPERWGSEFPTCGKGRAQAPLNIKGPFVKGRISVNADYKAGPLRMLNNGHTVQVNVAAGSKLRVDGVPYELVQFHFHRPSEEQIDGKPMAMVIHFVHKSADGKLAVLGVLLKEGNENPGIKTLWTYAPAVEGPEVAPEEVVFNPANLLPKEFDFFSYEGSLTTPPCTEGVRFFILKAPVNVSREQVSGFPFKRNARPVQPLNDRVITSG